MPSLKSEVAVDARADFEIQALETALQLNTCVLMYRDAGGKLQSLVRLIGETPSAIDRFLQEVVGVSLFDINPAHPWALAFYPYRDDLVVKGKGDLTSTLKQKFWHLVHCRNDAHCFN